MTKHYHIHLGPKRTADSDDSEGRWVTIMGAHVHISDGGKIDKGPAALVGKSEHEGLAHQHNEAGNAHYAAAEAKGKNHPDTKRHEAAMREHWMAGAKFAGAHHAAVAGDVKHAQKVHAEAQNHASAAVEHEKNLAQPAKAPDKKDAPADKPKAHEKLHDAAAKAVKGSEKHEAEHKRLMGLYDKSSAAWEKSAVNRMIERNHVYALGHHANTAHAMAKTASDHAKKTGRIDDHETAARAAEDAIQKRVVAGALGGPKGAREELEGMKKHHEGKIAAHKKAPDAGKPKSKLAFKSLEDARAALGEAAAKQLQAKGALPPAAAPAPAAPAKKGGGVNSEAHADAAATHRAKAMTWANPAHGQLEEGGKEVAALHSEAAAHHDYMAQNPHEDHSARAKALADLKQRIARGESLVQTGKGHELTGKPKWGSKSGRLIDPGFAKTMNRGQQKLSGVQGATEAVKGLKDLVKKTGEQADPDPKKQA